MCKHYQSTGKAHAKVPQNLIVIWIVADMVQGRQHQAEGDAQMPQRAQGASKARLKAPQREALATLQMARGHQQGSTTAQPAGHTRLADAGRPEAETPAPRQPVDASDSEELPAGQPALKRCRVLAKAQPATAPQPDIEDDLADF